MYRGVRKARTYMSDIDSRKEKQVQSNCTIYRVHSAQSTGYRIQGILPGTKYRALGIKILLVVTHIRYDFPTTHEKPARFL